MRKTRDANRIARLIDRNVDDLYADRKTHAAQRIRNRTLWDRADVLGIADDVMAIIRKRRDRRVGTIDRGIVSAQGEC